MEWVTRQVDSFDQAYFQIFTDLLDYGTDVKPRGMETLECPQYCIKINNPRKRIITNPARHLSAGFLVSEFLWIISGSEDVDMISFYNKQWLNFTDTRLNGEKYFHGSYGPRIRYWSGIDQLYEVYKKLHDDHDTRQAIIMIFDPQRDFQVAKDIPCNDLIQFTIRENKLNMTVYVRSQDAVFGFPYDVFHWTMMQEILASLLNVDLGYYFNISNSMHLYKRNMGMIKQITSAYEKMDFDAVPEMEKMPKIRSFNSFNNTICSLCHVENSIRVNTAVFTNMLNCVQVKYWRELMTVLYCHKKFKIFGSCNEINNDNFIRPYWKMLFDNYQSAKSQGKIVGAVHDEKL